MESPRRYGYTESTRTFTKAWPREYDDLWQGIPVPHCRPRRSAASADRQVRWRALAVVPCRRKLTGWKEAVMGGGRGAGGQEGGMALAEERRSSPNAHPSFPPSLTPERSGAGATSRTAPSTRGGRGPGGSRRAQHHRSRSWAPSSTDLQDQERARRRRGHRAAAAALLTAPTEGPGA